MKNKSMSTNALLNGFRTILTIIFPLITFPYISRVLQVENLGMVNFSSSIISYFLLLAELGVNNYAIREGAQYKDNPKLFNKFVSEVFTINLFSTLLSYLLLFLSIIFIPTLKEYKILLLIQSISILFQTIGVQWIYSIFEDYVYITVRSIIFQLLSLVSLFAFVRNPNDYIIYAIILVFSSVGSNLLNYINSRKYCKISLTSRVDLKKHLKPIIIIFSTTIATTIYVNSDITMLGIMTDNYNVGIYSLSSKIYSVLKSLIASVIIVSMSRLSYYYSNGLKESFKISLTNILNSLSLILFPIVVGINILDKEIVQIAGGIEYLEAVPSLKILSIALIFSSFASFTTTCIILPMRNEKYNLVATLYSAIANVGLNFALIPIWKENGAAITTVIAEFLILSISLFYVYKTARDVIKFKDIKTNVINSIVSSLSIVLISYLLKIFVNNFIIYTFGTVILGMIAYVFCLILFKNKIALNILNVIIGRMHKNK